MSKHPSNLRYYRWGHHSTRRINKLERAIRRIGIPIDPIAYGISLCEPVDAGFVAAGGELFAGELAGVIACPCFTPDKDVLVVIG